MGKLSAVLVGVVLLAACDVPFPLLPQEAPDGVQLGFVCRLGDLVVLRGWLILPDWAAEGYFDPDTGEQYTGNPGSCSGPAFLGAVCRVEPWTAKGPGSDVFGGTEAGHGAGDPDEGNV